MKIVKFIIKTVLILLVLIIILLVLIFRDDFISPYREVKVGELIANKYVSFKMLSNKWEIYKDYNIKDFEKLGGVLSLNKHIPGANFEITVETQPFSFMSINMLFDPNGDYDAQSKKDEASEYVKNRNKEQGITYDHDETQYVKGLRCMGSVFSRGNGKYSTYNFVNKNYSITCGYYHKTDGKRLLIIDYTLSYAFDNTRLQGDENIKKLPDQKKIEKILKQEVKNLVNSITIKDMDIKRMKKEGLLHNIPFKSTKW